MIEFKNASASYDGELPILRDVSFRIPDGDFVAFVGTNGAGKSTTMRLINGLLKPSSGQVLIDGVPTTQLRTSQLAAKVGCVDVDDMYKQMRHTINIQKGKELPKLMVDRAVEKIIERLDGEVPEYYVNFICQDVSRELIQGLEKQGTNLQQWMLDNSVNGDQMKDDISAEATRRAAIDCALEAVFVEKGLEVTDEDIDKMFEGDEDPAATRKAWEDANRMADIRKMCRQHKATEWLVDNAEVTIVDEYEQQEQQGQE